MIKHVCILALTLLSASASYTQPRSIPRPDKVTIVPKQIVIVRTGNFARNFPTRKRATIRYPFVSGLRDASVLSKVRSLLHFEHVFDTSLREYREWNWLDEFGYKVNYNGDYILDVTFTQSGMAAYRDSQSRTIVINLKTGDVLKARDVFVEEKSAELARAVNAKLQSEAAAIIKIATGHQDAASIIEALRDAKFEINNLDDFSISKDGVIFLYDLGLPRAHRAFEPKGRYLFGSAELKSFIKPDGPLARFIP